MRGEKDKVLKIMNELVCFFFILDILHPRIHIDMEDTHTTITVQGEYKNPDQKKLDRFAELVNVSRQDDYDEYYWNLAGNSKYPELILLGTLVDSATVEYEDDILSITVIRNH
ncbi:MAG TPA: hypothetical protein GXX75_07010 [Clostridiales bacterium]|nr:hypothetical protein [Clostridiales bacterium]